MSRKVVRCRLLHMSLETKLKLLMAFILVPLAVLICFLLSALVRYSGQYDSIIQNLTVASEFSFDYKKNLDYKVYRFIISGKNFEEFNPFEDIEQARSVVARLERTTTSADSRRSLWMIRKFLGNVEKAIADIRDNNEGYDWSIAKWDGSVLINTELLNENIYQYIYNETRLLADIRQQTRKQVEDAVVTIGAVSVVLFVMLCVLGMSTATSITRPIKALCQNIRMVGQGDFTVRPVESHTDEIQDLSENFGGMVEQIARLMENIRQEQQNLRQMEFKLLQAQINPHFLYNTLDTIIWLAEDHQDEKVSEMVTSLSTYFRTTLSKGRDVISVREEELHVCSYLEIQKVRYSDILEYDIPIPEALYGFEVPKLTLQPLVENALYHGIKNKRGGGRIVVWGGVENGMLIFRVTDNGIGISREQLEQLRESVYHGGKVGYGLTNVHERIQLYYGKEYGLEIDSTYGEGTTVKVRLPVKEIQLQA